MNEEQNSPDAPGQAHGKLHVQWPQDTLAAEQDADFRTRRDRFRTELLERTAKLVESGDFDPQQTLQEQDSDFSHTLWALKRLYLEAGVKDEQVTTDLMMRHANVLNLAADMAYEERSEPWEERLKGSPSVSRRLPPGF